MKRKRLAQAGTAAGEKARGSQLNSHHIQDVEREIESDEETRPGNAWRDELHTEATTTPLRTSRRRHETRNASITPESTTRVTPSAASRRSVRSTRRRHNVIEDGKSEDDQGMELTQDNVEDGKQGEGSVEEPEHAQDDITSSNLNHRGRPKGRRKKERSPTPPRTLPPHEHYFFQNRPGGIQTSGNTLPSEVLLTHEEYFEAMKKYRDPHHAEIDFLHDIHSDGFYQWLFELEQGFNICLHGWGSKRRLLLQFADFVTEAKDHLEIVVLNGFATGTSVHDLLASLASVIPNIKDQKLPANPAEALHVVLSALSRADNAPARMKMKYLVIINSLDASQLRRGNSQALLARLASQSSVSMIGSCDTTTFPLLWDINIRTTFNWVFHDATTFASFDAEVGGGSTSLEDHGAAGSGAGVIDEVNALLGRSGRKVHGKEGVAFVLRSLTESARRLFGLLIAEVLSMGDLETLDADAQASNDDENVDMFADSARQSGKGRSNATGPSIGAGIEYRTFYRKAVEALITTSEMQFRQLLKEFYDHEMLTSKKDSTGTEMLSLPFRREELESILEEVELGG